jgi:hypothetical protein
MAAYCGVCCTEYKDGHNLKEPALYRIINGG